MSLYIYCMILSLVFLSVNGKTALEKTCATFPYSFYHGHSCFIGPSAVKTFNPAKTQCEAPKPNLPIGHLAYILTQETLNALIDSYADGKLHGSNGHYYIGLQQIPANDESAGGTKGWTWTHPNLPNRPVPHHDIILWDYNSPNGPHNGYSIDDVAAINVAGGGAITDVNTGANIFYLCEYEEPTFRMYHVCYKNKIGHNTTMIAEYEGLSRVGCARACASDLMCRSFSFNQMTGHCYTHWTDGGFVNFEPIQQNGYNFFVSDYSYNKKTGSFCSATMP